MKQLSRAEFAVLGAAIYLAALFMSTICLWWMVLIGGNPFTVGPTTVVDTSGREVTTVSSGDVIGVSSQLCSESRTVVEYFPSLHGPLGFVYPLPQGVVTIPAGCSTTIHGFIVPGLPIGQYAYVSTYKFQKNLVGRDEQADLPQIKIVIARSE